MIDRAQLKGELLYLDDDYGISFQDLNGLAMCHCQVRKATPSILRRCRLTIHKLQREYQRDAYGICYKADHKHKRFLTMMGFEFFRNKWIVDEHDNDLIIEIWRLDYAKYRNRAEQRYTGL